MLRYEDTTLMIDSMALKSPEGLYTAVGEFPINLSLNGERELFDGRSQDIEISAHDKRLDFPSFALNSVDYMLGDFDAQLRLWGTPHEPHLDGTSSLKNGEVKLTELEDPLENVSVDLSMSDKLITINELSAIVKGKNHSGKLNGGGTFLINAVDTFTYAIRLNASNAPIHYELGDFSALANAQLRVNGVTPPTVRGTITLKDAYYRENFTSEGSGMNLLTALEADKTWDLDIMVEMPSQAWVKNNDIDAEFSGSVNIIRRNGKYNFLGTLEVIRGKYYLFDRTFRLEPGGQIIYDNIEEPNPRLDLQMTTRIRTPRGYSDFATESSYTIDLTLYVTGTLENPIISAGGDEIVSNEDLLPLLFADFNPNQEGQSGANPALAERITIGGVGLLASQVSKIGARQLGLETFEITPERGGEFDPLETRLTIGAYTLPNLYVFGTSSLSFNGGQEVGVEYRIGRHYLFEGRRDENSQYHFNFKLQWEY
jgi:autotransporter translocation and assembly factor TamB